VSVTGLVFENMALPGERLIELIERDIAGH
jgi:hypothetical protein